MKAFAVFLVVVLSLGGCQHQSVDPQTLALRDKLVLTTEPSDAKSLSDVAEAISAQADSSEPQPVVVVGRIYAGELEPWEPGKASFILAELPAEGHGEGHDADNCPFCKRRAAKAPTAMVKFVDEQNETLAVDARKLFDVDQNQVVVITGRATQAAFNTLAITADQIYVKSER